MLSRPEEVSTLHFPPSPIYNISALPSSTSFWDEWGWKEDFSAFWVYVGGILLLSFLDPASWASLLVVILSDFQ